MNIGFDAKRAFFNATGLGAYSRAALRAVQRQLSDAKLFLYCPKKPVPGGAFSLSGNTVFRTPRTRVLEALHPLWRSLFLSSEIGRDALDIYHGLTNELPWGIEKTRTRSVVTIHDLIFLRYPETYPFVDRKVYAAKCRHAVRVASCVVADSRQTRDDLCAFLNCDPEKIRVVYPSVDPAYFVPLSEEAITEVRGRYGLSGQYILSVGSITRRKNLFSLVKAVERVRASVPMSLVVCGSGSGSYFSSVKSYITGKKLEASVVFLGHADPCDLPALYQGASVFAYPSVFEGFGLPIAEALASRVPVITSRGSCFSEAGGAASLYVAPFDDSALANALERILSNAALRKSMIDQGALHGQKFTEEVLGSELARIYGLLVNATGRKDV